jgi:predicted deacylase
MTHPAADLPFGDYQARFEKAAKKNGGDVRRLANGACLARFGAAESAPLAFMSGVHGDERSGPLALLRWLEGALPGGLCPPDQGLWVAPLLNDAGWDAQTREWNGLNLNAAFLPGIAPPFLDEVMADLAAHRPRLFLDFHEDSEKPFPYVYRYTEDRHDLAQQLQHVLGIQEVTWSPADQQRWKGSSETYVRGLGCDHCATLELPPVWPIEKRIGCYVRTIRWCVHERQEG